MECLKIHERTTTFRVILHRNSILLQINFSPVIYGAENDKVCKFQQNQSVTFQHGLKCPIFAKIARKKTGKTITDIFRMSNAYFRFCLRTITLRNARVRFLVKTTGIGKH